MSKQRLVTRSDFDGLVCAILLKELDMIDEIVFAHPGDIQHGKIAITGGDMTADLPYVPGVGMAFDHHASEILRNPGEHPNLIIRPDAPSSARVVFDHFGGRQGFPESFQEIMEAVDKADSAQFSRNDILHPTRWVLLNHLIDPRTGLGRFRNFRISYHELMLALVDYCRDHSIEAILDLPDVKERVGVYVEHEPRAEAQIRRCATLHQNLVVLDLRREQTIWATNRFMIYALFPEANISIHVMSGAEEQNTMLAAGKSNLNRTSKTNIGALMLQYGGGGHEAAGTCHAANDETDVILANLVQIINTDG